MGIKLLSHLSLLLLILELGTITFELTCRILSGLNENKIVIIFIVVIVDTLAIQGQLSIAPGNLRRAISCLPSLLNL